MPRKKVLVSGCFDLLHSGHVEFFREAAQHGDLYVRIGTAANIKALKNHETMYSDAERLFMVKHIKGVHDAALSCGTGRFDFVEDAKVLKPDIYFVNDDASKLEERMSLFEKAGLKVKIVVAARKPSDGLEERSSTSMKERLHDMVMRDQATKQSLPMSAFHETIPWRCARGRLSNETRFWALGRAADRVRVCAQLLFLRRLDGPQVVQRVLLWPRRDDQHQVPRGNLPRRVRPRDLLAQARGQAVERRLPQAPRAHEGRSVPLGR